MTLLSQARRAILRLGFDVQRARDTPPARLAELLDRRGVDHVLDVGANQGQYARQLRFFGYKGVLHSFEPLPRPYEVLARRAIGDANWSVHNLALGDVDGPLELNVAGNSGAASSSVLPMLPRHEQAAPEARYVDRIEVPVRRLDGIWDELVPPSATTFIKLDVQGFEGAVLDGAGGRLQSASGIQLELSLVALYEGAISVREALDRANALGMNLVHIEPGFTDPQTLELLQIDGVFMRPEPGEASR